MKSAARTAVVSLVSSDVTSSTRRMTGTGLKKCSPRTSSGRLVIIASRMIGIDDVFEARIVPGPVTASSCSKTAALASKSSTTAPTTSSRSARSAIRVENFIRSRASARASGASLPRSTALARDDSMRRRPAFRASRPASTTMTLRPARAQTSAMPEPMSPQPTTPTRSMTAGTSDPGPGSSARSVLPLVGALFVALSAMDILPWGVGNGWVLRAAHGWRLGALAGPLCHPRGPVLPPRALVWRRCGPPLVGVVRELVVGPVPALGAGRVDDACDVARRRQHVAALPTEQPRRCVRCGPGCDVILDRADDVHVRVDLAQQQRPAGERHLVLGQLVLLVAVAEVEGVHVGRHPGAVRIPG